MTGEAPGAASNPASTSGVTTDDVYLTRGQSKDLNNIDYISKLI